MNAKPMRTTLAAVVVLLSAGAVRAQEPLSSWRIAPTAEGLRPCVAPTATMPGDTVVAEPARALCDVVAVPVVQLRASPDGAHPDPGPHVAMTSDGRYITKAANTPERQMVVWDGSGAFVRALGRAGEGPGELDPRGFNHFVGAGDSLYVSGTRGRWSVFGPDLAFARSFNAPVHYSDETVHLLDGRMLSTRPGAAGEGRAFALLDLDGEVDLAFGPSDDRPSERSGAVSAEGTLWALPPSGTRTGLVLDEWTLAGERRRTLVRAAPWLPADGYEPAEGEPALPEFEAVHIDPDGLLWVRLVTRDPRWRMIADRDAKMAAMAELYDGRVEAIHPASGTVLASLRVDGPDEELPPLEFIPGTRRAYRLAEDELGFHTIEIFDIHLVAGGS